MRNKIAVVPAVSILLAAGLAIAHAQTVTGSVALPGQPEQLAVNPLTNRIYVAVPNFGAQPFDYLTVIDGSKDTVITNIQILPVAYAVAVDPLREVVYVGGTYEDVNGITQSKVVAVSERANKVIAEIPVSTTPGDGIHGLAVDWLTGDVYVTNSSDSEVDVIHHVKCDERHDSYHPECDDKHDDHHFKVKTRIPVDGDPYGVAVNPFHNKVYVALLNGNVLVINARSGHITATTPFGDSDAGIAVDIVTDNVFTTNSVGSPLGSVGVLGRAGNLLATIPVGDTPLGIDVDFVTHLAFVANSQDDTLSVINGTTDTVTATLPVSSLFLAVNPTTEKVYIAPADPVASLTVMTEK